MKNYEMPNIVLTKLSLCDVLTVSGMTVNDALIPDTEWNQGGVQ